MEALCESSEATGRATEILKTDQGCQSTSKQLASASRINLDTLESRRKETALFHEFLATRVDIIIDNTKPTRFEYKRTVPAGSKQPFLPA